MQLNAAAGLPLTTTETNDRDVCIDTEAKISAGKSSIACVTTSNSAPHAGAMCEFIWDGPIVPTTSPPPTQPLVAPAINPTPTPVTHNGLGLLDMSNIKLCVYVIEGEDADPANSYPTEGQIIFTLFDTTDSTKTSESMI